MISWEDAKKNLIKRRESVFLSGGREKIKVQHEKGKLTARERINILFDKGSFVEIDAMVEAQCIDFGMDKKHIPGDGVIIGYGNINGQLAFVSSEDFTVMGGTAGEYHSLKISHIQDMAVKMNAPLIMINDSGGARIEEGIQSLNGYGEIFLRNVKASGKIPQIAVILGPCSGGACYSPALCDFIFFVRNIGKMFITGPKVVETVTNETISAEELGGAFVHEKISGVTHVTYDNEKECIDGIKELLGYLKNQHKVTKTELKSKAEIHEKDIVKIVPDNMKKSYDVHNVIKSITDDGRFFELQPLYAANVVIGLAYMGSRSVGIIANQPSVLAGAIDCDASVKIARFIRTCDCFNLPIITLVDTPAFYPGKNQEYQGIIRHGAKILYAYSEASVPMVTLIMRKAYGGAYIAMGSKSIGVDIVYAWPIAEIAVMGGKGAVNIISKKEIETSEDKKEKEDSLIRKYDETYLNPYVAAKRGYVTEVILPEETRLKLLDALKLLENKKLEITDIRHGNIPL